MVVTVDPHATALAAALGRARRDRRRARRPYRRVTAADACSPARARRHAHPARRHSRASPRRRSRRCSPRICRRRPSPSSPAHDDLGSNTVICSPPTPSAAVRRGQLLSASRCGASARHRTDVIQQPGHRHGYRPSRRSRTPSCACRMSARARGRSRAIGCSADAFWPRAVGYAAATPTADAPCAAASARPAPARRRTNDAARRSSGDRP